MQKRKVQSYESLLALYQEAPHMLNLYHPPTHTSDSLQTLFISFCHAFWQAREAVGDPPLNERLSWAFHA
eukprot:1152599-Pelagomonas_calceolata.AAC.6